VRRITAKKSVLVRVVDLPTKKNAGKKQIIKKLDSNWRPFQRAGTKQSFFGSHVHPYISLFQYLTIRSVVFLAITLRERWMSDSLFNSRHYYFLMNFINNSMP